MSPRRSIPDYLSRFPLLETGDLDESRQITASTWEKHRVNLRDKGPFHTRINGIGDKDCSLAYVNCSNSLRIECEPGIDHYYLQLPLSGFLEQSINGVRAAADPLHAGLHSPGQSLVLSPTPIQLLLFQVHRERVHSVFTSRAFPLSQMESWAHTLSLQTVPGKSLKRYVLWWAEEINRIDSPLTGTDAFAHASSTVLALLADCLESLRPSPKSKSPHFGSSFLQNLELWMEANQLKALSVDDLAIQAGVSTRMVQLAFQKYRECTPMQFLRNLRLESVRRKLRGVNHGGIPKIAMEYGFLHLGRFAEYYRKRFGENPSETIRKWKSLD